MAQHTVPRKSLEKRSTWSAAGMSFETCWCPGLVVCEWCMHGRRALYVPQNLTLLSSVSEPRSDNRFFQLQPCIHPSCHPLRCLKAPKKDNPLLVHHPVPTNYLSIKRTCQPYSATLTSPLANVKWRCCDSEKRSTWSSWNELLPPSPVT